MLSTGRPENRLHDETSFEDPIPIYEDMGVKITGQRYPYVLDNMQLTGPAPLR